VLAVKAETGAMGAMAETGAMGAMAGAVELAELGVRVAKVGRVVQEEPA
jgi:hypothetical protein